MRSARACKRWPLRPRTTPKSGFEQGSAAFEKLLGAKSLDKAVEVQSDYVRSAYEGYVGQVTKIGEIVADMAKSAYKPYEGLFGKYGK